MLIRIATNNIIQGAALNLLAITLLLFPVGAATAGGDPPLPSGETPENPAGRLTELAEIIEGAGFVFSGAVKLNYSYKDFDAASKDKGGDFTFSQLRLGVDAEIDDILLSAQYRWYGDMDTVHHAWIGYNFSEELQCQLGVTEAPFGILPYADHNYWEGVAYTLGLEDEYDLGLKFLYRPAPWDIQVAFFKNGEWGDPSNLKRYSYDVVKALGEENEETNQFNARLTYTFEHGELGRTEVGLSGLWGQLYNGVTEKSGSHWAGAVHLDGYYGPFNLMLEVIEYRYDPKNPPGVDDRLVVMGGFDDAFYVAAKGTVLIAALSYDLPVEWGPVENLRFYNDFSVLIKDETGFNDSYINTPGCEITAGPVYVYLDAIMGKNALYLGGPDDSFAAGAAGEGWHTRFNVNIGYYF